MEQEDFEEYIRQVEPSAQQSADGYWASTGGWVETSTRTARCC